MPPLGLPPSSLIFLTFSACRMARPLVLSVPHLAQAKPCWCEFGEKSVAPYDKCKHLSKLITKKKSGHPQDDSTIEPVAMVIHGMPLSRPFNFRCHPAWKGNRSRVPLSN